MSFKKLELLYDKIQKMSTTNLDGYAGYKPNTEDWSDILEMTL